MKLENTTQMPIVPVLPFAFSMASGFSQLMGLAYCEPVEGA